jgi:hypothetical protein
MISLEQRAQDPEFSQRVAAAATKKKSVGKLAGLVKRHELNGVFVEVLSMNINKKYDVQVRGSSTYNEHPGIQGGNISVQSENLRFEPGAAVFLHSLKAAKERDGKEGVIKSYSDGRFAVKLDKTKRLLAIKPENIVAKHQEELKPDIVQTNSLILTAISEGYNLRRC